MSKSTPTVDNLFAAAETRISCYTLTKESSIPDSRLYDIVGFAIKHAPSSFNVQSARAVILTKAEHDKLWEIADQTAKSTKSEKEYGMLSGMVRAFAGAYGTVLWFEDTDALDGLAAKNPMFGHLVPQWGDHSSGMHQFIVWTAFELEGLGCNLQHFNFMPEFSEAVLQHWNLPRSWQLKSQLVFGKPENGLVRKKDRTYAPVEERLKLIGS
jgi:hypothetical protein